MRKPHVFNTLYKTWLVGVLLLGKYPIVHGAGVSAALNVRASCTIEGLSL
jgi:hypothetical protein